MSNSCLSHVRHSDINTINKCTESDDRKVAMFDELNRCACCAENSMLRNKLLQYEATISSLEAFVKSIVSKQEVILCEVDRLRKLTEFDFKDQESPEDVVENPGQNGDENDTISIGDFEAEIGAWQTPFMGMSVPSNPTISQAASPVISLAASPATSQPSSDAEEDSFQDLILAMYTNSDIESDAN
ncbi:uncharacterized protein [Drosophila pseudoobscura]|uniref:Uncharacterized protein n=1 Tax=Drosophila pseudoobscura pseudoobscura TaxID=46245 RepID=A0A6I8UNW9_DROPS|nr:uncharacterized protein LOC4801415 [Drosophila pseudoobscura]